MNTSRGLVVGFGLMLVSSFAWAAGGAGLIDHVKTLVELNSGTANTEGVLKVQNWIAAELKALGFEVQLNEDRLLVATLKGLKPEMTTLLVHADTVFESASPFQNFVIRGETAVGPGVVDNKGGIVVALEGLRRYLKHGVPKRSLRFVSSSSEEKGSPQHHGHFRKIAEDSQVVLGFEPALEDGSIIESRKGGRWYDISVVGKEAHAGRDHRSGVNACVALARKIQDLSQLTNYRNGETVSVGQIQGGGPKYNVVCGEAQAKLDTRFPNFKSREKLGQKIEKILNRPDPKGARVTYQVVEDCPPFSASPQARPLLDLYLKKIESAENRKVGSGLSGGAADSNYMSREGLTILDGLGPRGGKMHTSEEFLIISSLETRAEALHQFLRALDP